jgi:hypothetical protein
MYFMDDLMSSDNTLQYISPSNEGGLMIMIRANLLVRTFVKILKEQFNRLMGLNFFMYLASFSLGMSVIMTKFSLYKSNLSLYHSLNIAIKSSLTTSQKV